MLTTKPRGTSFRPGSYRTSWPQPPVIKEEQDRDPDVFCDLIELYDAMKEFKERRHVSRYYMSHLVSPEGVKRFLSEEVALSGVGTNANARA